MSILLEALRKSEKKQRSREVPTIHSEVLSSETSGSLRPLPVVLMLAVTLLVSAWFVWQQYRAPESAATPGPVAQVNGASTEADSADSGPLAVDKPQPSPQSSTVDASRQGQRARTPMEDYQPAITDTAQVTNENTGKKPGATGDAGQKMEDPATKPVNSPPSAGDTSRSANQPREPAPISYWELPDSIRTNVPEIKFTVLVYNENPAKRFVIINGERFTEGESHQPGLVVREIRRDGVIFSYRLYQFLVER